MLLKVSPEQSNRSTTLYERITFRILRDEDPIGALIINRVQMRKDANEMLDAFVEYSNEHQALQAVLTNAWGNVSVMDRIVSLRIDPAYRGCEYGALALTKVPSPSGTWQALLPYPLDPVDGVSASCAEVEGLTRYWTRAGFRRADSLPENSFMVRNSA